MGLLITPMSLGACGLAAALFMLLHSVLRFKVDQREPPVVYPSIPLVGHVIGLLTNGLVYMKELSQKHKHPIFTMPMLFGRTYVVTAPELCAAVQKASTALSYDPIIAQMAPRLIGSNSHTTRIFQNLAGGQKDSLNFMEKSHLYTVPPLLPKNIQGISKVQLDYFGEVIAKIRDGSEVNLFRYVAKAVTTASMMAFFGPNNPFEKRPELVDSFWDWEKGNVAYMIGFLPKIFARKASRGLEACVKGFEEYVETDGYKEAHDLVREGNQFHLDEGITSKNERARLEIGMSLGVNVNASGTTFWTVNNVFSRPELLSKIREEIRSNALVGHGIISVASLREACPQLNSAYKETMRLYVPSTSARFVREDTIIADKWLVRKNAVVQIAGSAMHHNPEIWGPDADSFNPDRFLYSMNGSKSLPDGTIPEGKAHYVHPAAFRSFGGGTTLCPGRHFAHMEILSLAAVLIMGFDIEPVNGTEWNPPADTKRLPITVMKPMAPLDVRMKIRPEFKGVKWEMRV